jgi:hypothetical protein
MNGVIILCLKKPAYAMGAFNLALSIKHFNPSVNITLVSDGEHERHYRPEHYHPFDTIKKINLCDYTDKVGRFQPGLAKINISKYSDYDHTLYIDADSLILKDIQPLIDDLILKPGYFYSEKMGSGGLTEEIEYNPWATNEKIWEYFKLDPETTITTINSSWFYFNKKSAPFFKKVLQNFNKGFTESQLKTQWGNTLPDELFFTGTMAQMNIDPEYKKIMFFGNSVDKRTFSELENDYYGFTLYGGIRTVREIYNGWYDRLMFKFCEKEVIEHRFKAYSILTGKHVNK